MTTVHATQSEPTIISTRPERTGSQPVNEDRMNADLDERVASQDADVERLRSLFAGRAAEFDAQDRFVGQNVADLKAAGIYGLAVPKEFGGGGASYLEISQLLFRLATACGSTALALAMHQHLVAALVWKWRHAQAPVGPLLTRIAAEQLVLVSTGGSDWLRGSGTAERVEGGFRINGKKIFASGSPAGDLLMTTAVYHEAPEGPTVLHFALPLRAPEVRLLDTWKTLGMRGTGSHDLEIRDAFVPDSAVSLKRPQGAWHPAMHLISKLALPLIYAVYAGLAQAMRDEVVAMVHAQRDNPETQSGIGALDTELMAVRLAYHAMIEAGAEAAPGPETTNHVMTARNLLERSALIVADQAMNVAGGSGFYRRSRLERLFRDIQAARYHPLRGPEQRRYAGRLALGLPEGA
jgi:alkylation response protein AidB-like acyl-CoA dehydrogenase